MSIEDIRNYCVGVTVLDGDVFSSCSSVDYPAVPYSADFSDWVAPFHHLARRMLPSTPNADSSAQNLVTVCVVHRETIRNLCAVSHSNSTQTPACCIADFRVTAASGSGVEFSHVGTCRYTGVPIAESGSAAAQEDDEEEEEEEGDVTHVRVASNSSKGVSVKPNTNNNSAPVRAGVTVRGTPSNTVPKGKSSPRIGGAK